MNDSIKKLRQKKVLILAWAFPLFTPLPLQAIQKTYNISVEMQQGKKNISAKQINPTTIELLFTDSQRMSFDFYGENIFRIFQDIND